MALIIFFLDSFLMVLLSPYGYLNFFVIGMVNLFLFMIHIGNTLTGFKYHSYLDAQPLIVHIVSSILLILMYYFSSVHLWNQRARYIKQP